MSHQDATAHAADGLGANKILGAILAAALLTVGLGVIVPEVFFPFEAPKKTGYAIAIPADLAGGTATAEAPEVPVDWGTALPKADVAAGQAATQVCQTCHNFSSAGTNMIGPGLYGVVGRQPGTHPGYAYSDAMKAFGQKQPIWDYEHIYQFIKGPGAYIPGTKMTYAGMKDSQTRINIIAYLHTLGSSLPIPKPNPPKTPAGTTAAPAGPTPAKGPPAGGVAPTPTPTAVQTHPGGEAPAAP